MKYYEREGLVRTEINHFGKIGYVNTIKMVKTNNIESFNKGKRIWFHESERAKKMLRFNHEQNVVYTFRD